MEGTSCADDMRLLHERMNKETFIISFGSDLVFGGRKPDTINVYNIILSAIEDGFMVRLQVVSKQSLYQGWAPNPNH